MPVVDTEKIREAIKRVQDSNKKVEFKARLDEIEKVIENKRQQIDADKRAEAERKLQEELAKKRAEEERAQKETEEKNRKNNVNAPNTGTSNDVEVFGVIGVAAVLIMLTDGFSIKFGFRGKSVKF